MIAQERIRQFLRRPELQRRIGPFLLERQLGRGGFAPVWLAREVYGGTELRRVAVKLFALEDDDDGSVRKRVIEEARLLCRVEHANVVRFFSLALEEDLGLVGLATEYLTGKTLAGRLAEATRPHLGEIVEIGISAASALAAVHSANLVHRDVKPDNLMESGALYKLIDFGIASVDRRRQSQKMPASGTRIVLGDLPWDVFGTRVSALANDPRVVGMGPVSSVAGISGLPGTLGYIDPVCMGTMEPATASSDLYSLGALLYECVTGNVPAAMGMPRGGGLRGAVVDGREHPQSISSVAPRVPKGLAALIDALVSPRREYRPATAKEVVDTLHRHRGLTTPHHLLSQAGPDDTQVLLNLTVDTSGPSADEKTEPSPEANPWHTSPIPDGAVHEDATLEMPVQGPRVTTGEVGPGNVAISAVRPDSVSDPVAFVNPSGGDTAPTRPRSLVWPLAAAGVGATVAIGLAVGAVALRSGSSQTTTGGVAESRVSHAPTPSVPRSMAAEATSPPLEPTAASALAGRSSAQNVLAPEPPSVRSPAVTAQPATAAPLISARPAPSPPIRPIVSTTKPAPRKGCFRHDSLGLEVFDPDCKG